MGTLVSTGQLTITDAFDTPRLTLTNAAAVVPTATDGSAGVYTGCATTASVLLGTTVVTSEWVITASPSAGVTGSLSSRTYTVTAMANDTGYVDITATNAKFGTLTARFNISKSKQGSLGPSVSISPDRTPTFLYADAAPINVANIVFTAICNGMSGQTYLWYKDGVSTGVTNSTYT